MVVRESWWSCLFVIAAGDFTCGHGKLASIPAVRLQRRSERRSVCLLRVHRIRFGVDARRGSPAIHSGDVPIGIISSLTALARSLYRGVGRTHRGWCRTRKSTIKRPTSGGLSYATAMVDPRCVHHLARRRLQGSPGVLAGTDAESSPRVFFAMARDGLFTYTTLFVFSAPWHSALPHAAQGPRFLTGSLVALVCRVVPDSRLGRDGQHRHPVLRSSSCALAGVDHALLHTTTRISGGRFRCPRRAAGSSAWASCSTSGLRCYRSAGTTGRG